MPECQERHKIAVITPESFPVPPVRGGAIETIIYQVMPYLSDKLAVCVISVADPALPLEHLENGVRFLHVDRKGAPLWTEKKTLRMLKVPLIRFPLKWYSSPYIEGMLKRIEEIQPDIVHIHNSPIYVLFIKRRFPNAKIILHMHNRHLVRMNRQLAAAIAREADLLAGVSQYIVEDILSAFPWARHKCQCLYNGVDTKDFMPKWELDVQSWRERFGIPKGHKVLLYAGRITKQKGVHVLLKALSREFPSDWALVIAGSSWFGEQKINKYMRQIQQLAAKISNPIIFTGYILHHEMPGLLAAADVTVLPSVGEEAFPLISLESASVGTPMLCNSVGGAAEAVIDGKTGFVNKDISAEGLQQKLQSIYCLSESDLASIGLQAHAHIEEYYSWPVCAAIYDKVYRELV